MTGHIRHISALPELRKGRKAEDAERREVAEALGRINRALKQAYLNFNLALEPELIEAYVFEINSLNAMYAYMLRRAKALRRAESRGEPESAPLRTEAVFG